MADQEVEAAKFHVLLIGVDNYPGHELRGCVNDIDEVQQVLLDRLAIPSPRIRRLAAPRTEAQQPAPQHPPLIAEQAPTLANIRAALTELGSDRVQPGDRVFIYYSGHGKRVLVSNPDGANFQREAIVPVDFDSPPESDGFLFDFELNRLLRAIAARTSSVAVMLDCCHAAGTTRIHGTVRTFDRGERDRVPIADPARERDAEQSGSAGSVDTCQVVSACLANETSREGDYNGKLNGMFTSAFVTAVRAERTDLRALTWDRIWHAMRSDVTLRNPDQNPRMNGSLRRAVFGGPPVDGDAGLAVSREGGGYRIAAGTMADLTSGTELAIYGPEPARFPLLGSAADTAVRLGVVRVDEPAPAVAHAVAIGTAFELPAGARGRVIKAGASSRLRCAVTPPDAAIEAELARSPILELVGAEPPAPVRLVGQGGRRYITDDQHGTGGTDAPVLFALDADHALGARAALEHYYRYSRPLRVAARATDLPGGLDLRVLLSPNDPVPARDAQDPKLSEAPMQDGRYQVPEGAAICAAIHNRADEELHVTLLNVAANGKVQVLGEASVLPGRRHVFWRASNLGHAFKMRLVDGADRSRDRFVAIGRTTRAHDLDYLRVTETFQQVVQDKGKDRPVDDESELAPLERWTAAQVVIETARR